MIEQTGPRVLLGHGTENDFVVLPDPDGSVWADVASFIGCCLNLHPQLIHLDASGSHLLADAPIYADAMVVDAAGNLYGTTFPSGDANCYCGMVFKLDKAGKEIVLHSFVAARMQCFPRQV